MRKLTLSLFVLPLVAACSEAPIPSGPESQGETRRPEQLPSLNRPGYALTPEAQGVAHQRIQLCHRKANGDYVRIEVSVASESVHRTHGDAAIGELVPGLPDMVFDDGCTPIALLLSFSFADPVGDHLQLTPVRRLNPPAGIIIDAVGLHFTFDNTSGEYEMTVIASATNPFVGGVRIAVFLFNPDTGTTAPNPAVFSTLDDFFLTTPTTTITLTGSDSNLLAWEAGDRVAACEGASFVEFGPCLGGLGLPDSILGFGTSVFTFTGSPSGLPKGTDVFFTAPPATISH